MIRIITDLLLSVMCFLGLMTLPILFLGLAAYAYVPFAIAGR